MQPILKELTNLLPDSRSVQRKHWAQRIIAEDIPVQDLFVLFHGRRECAQRFMWLIGDICEADPDRVAPALPLLFSMRDQMTFPGMHRSLAKWLRLTNVPDSVAREAIPQLATWLESEEASIACKSYSALALFDLVQAQRYPAPRLDTILLKESAHTNRAYGKRINKLLQKLREQVR